MDNLAIFSITGGADDDQLENGHLLQNPTETAFSLTVSAVALKLTWNSAIEIPHVLKSECIHFRDP